MTPGRRFQTCLLWSCSKIALSCKGRDSSAYLNLNKSSFLWNNNLLIVLKKKQCGKMPDRKMHMDISWSEWAGKSWNPMSNSGVIPETSIWKVSSPVPETIVWRLIDIFNILCVYPWIWITPKFVPNKYDLENIIKVNAEDEKEEACEREVFFPVYRNH